jgi:hypothetical protein
MRCSRSIRVLLVAVIVLSSTVLGPAVQTADAIHDCSSTDALVAMFSFSLINEDECTDSHRADAIQQMKESDAKQEKLDIYQATISQRESVRSKQNVRENYLQDSQTPAWNKGEATYMDMRANGTSHTLARSEARATVRDYYQRQQRNILANWELTILEFEYLRNVSDSEDNISEDYLTVRWDASENDGGKDEVVSKSLWIEGFPKVAAQGVNGSKINTTAIKFRACAEHSDGSRPCDSYTWVPGKSRTFPVGRDWDSPSAYFTVKSLYVKPPNDDYDPATYTGFTRWNDIWNNLEDTQTRLNDNIDKFTEQIDKGIQNGTVDPANATSAQTLAQEYSTQYNETGYWSYSVARLSALGLSSPDLDQTSQMTVKSGNNVYTGILMSQDAPDNGTWRVGKQYDAGKIPGMQIMVTTSGDRHKLQGKFSIQEMKDEQGMSIDETSTQTYSYKTTNTSGYLELQAQLEELRQEIEEQEPKASGGGGSSGQSPLEELATALGVSVTLVAGGVIAGSLSLLYLLLG